MTLEVFTARIGTRDPDALLIVRWTGSITARSELAFAPSEAILGPAIATRRQADAKRERAAELEKTGGVATAIELRRQADALEATRWAWYEPRYLAEMRVSWGLRPEEHGALEREAVEHGVRPARGAWKAILARERVVLTCFCTDPERCHRRLLARILVKCGAVDRGELAAPVASRDLKPDNLKSTPPPPALDEVGARAELHQLVAGLRDHLNEWGDAA